MVETRQPSDVTVQDYLSPVEIAWCPGCGNFGILRAVKKALVDFKIAASSGVNCVRHRSSR